MLLKSKNRYTNVFLENLIVNQNNKNVINYFKDYVKNADKKINNGENTIITSGVGLGKTYITKAFLNSISLIKIKREIQYWKNGTGEITEIIEDNIKTEYILMSDLIAELRKEYNNQKPDLKYFNCDILVIDEVGLQFGSDAERQILFKLINYRYDYFKPIILLSNHPLNSTEFEKGLYYILGERIMDRINNSSCQKFTITGKTMR